MLAIELKNLTKYFGKVRGIELINLKVQQGEFFGFIGPNGAGKSTAIRTMLGLIHATAGEARLFGKSITADKTTILQQVGYMPSEINFYSGMRVTDILTLAAKLRHQDCSAEAEQLCEWLKLDMHKKVETLSLGNRKKVAIVCALQHRPNLYVLDEPTSGLDPLIQKAFFDILEQRHAAGATVFLSSHVLNEIQQHCERAAIIRNGKIIACDTTENLSKSTSKRITIRGLAQIPHIEGMFQLDSHKNHVTFQYNGALQPLLQLISSLSIDDLVIEEPKLEDIFKHYYEEE